MLSKIISKKRLVGISAYILSLIILGNFTAKTLNIILPLDKSVVPSFFQILIANLSTSSILMLCNLFWGSGILGVTYLSFFLGLQFYSVIIAYGTHNLLYIILILAIHGTFELFAMAIICSASIDILSIWKNYLFGSVNSIKNEYKYFFKNTFINGMILIFIFILVGSILEIGISSNLFKLLV